MNITFDNISSQFARFDANKNQIWIYDWLLTEAHEGQHNSTVNFTYGTGVLKFTASEILQIRVPKAPSHLHGKAPNPVPFSLPFVKKTPQGVFVGPIDFIKNIKDFEVKPSAEKGYWIPEQPVPRLYSLSATGLVKIVWDREM